MSAERKIVSENIRRFLVKEFVMQRVQGAGFGGMDIIRTPMGTRVTLTIERPGIVIGRKGGAIKQLTTDLSEKFDLSNPQIEVQEIKRYHLNAQIMAEKLASALERGWKFRRAGHSTVRRIMEGGAKGCQVTIAGKLTGRRHRTAKFKQGHIKFCGEPSLEFMDRGYAVAKLKPGVLGVSVWIMTPDSKLPDEIEVFDRVLDAPSESVIVEETDGIDDEIIEELVEGSEEVSVVVPSETKVDKVEAPVEKVEKVDKPVEKVENVDKPVEKVEPKVEEPEVEPEAETKAEPKVDKAEKPKVDKVEKPAEKPVEKVEEPKVDKVEKPKVDKVEKPKVDKVEKPAEKPVEKVETKVEEPEVEPEAETKSEPKVDKAEEPKAETKVDKATVDESPPEEPKEAESEEPVEESDKDGGGE